MAIKKKSKTVKPYIDLDSPDGNSFNLIGKANRLAKELDLDGKEILEEMMNGDYEHLIKVFDKYFGEYVDLYRS
jgi:hypothetical protein